MARTAEPGCESQFAELDNYVKKFGGTATVSTLSNKHVIKKNRFSESENWKILTLEEKKSKFAWARASSQDKKVALLQKEWIGKVKDAKNRKETKKKKRNERSLLLLEKCKEHSGPVTMNTTAMLEGFSEPQLLLEVRYLRSTIAPNIRERVKVDKKFRKLCQAELKSEILKVIKPESDVTSLDSLFLSLFPDCEAGNDTIENSTEGSAAIAETGTHLGLAGLWLGPLQEKCVGVVVARGVADLLQLYSKGRHGYYADGDALELEDWSLVEALEITFWATVARIEYLRF